MELKQHDGSKNLKLGYFGGEPIGVPVLKELLAAGITPELVVCNPDRPSGRKLRLTPPPVKVLAEENNIPTFQPESVKNREQLSKITSTDWDLFIVVAYSHLMPEWLIELPKHKTLNVHPSMLPQYRGPNPIRTAILEDNREAVGVSIMVLDEEMDHGPILAQQTLPIPDSEWPPDGQVLDQTLAELGGSLLADIIPRWLKEEIVPHQQDHEAATYTKKMNRAMSEIVFDPSKLPTGEAAYQTLLKIRGYSGWPGTFFWYQKKRIKVTEAAIVNDTLKILRVIPEGKPKMRYEEWLEREGISV